MAHGSFVGGVPVSRRSFVVVDVCVGAIKQDCATSDQDQIWVMWREFIPKFKHCSYWFLCRETFRLILKVNGSCKRSNLGRPKNGYFTQDTSSAAYWLASFSYATDKAVHREIFHKKPSRLTLKPKAAWYQSQILNMQAVRFVEGDFEDCIISCCNILLMYVIGYGQTCVH